MPLCLILLTRWVCRGSVDRELDLTVEPKVPVCCKQLHHLVANVCCFYDDTTVHVSLGELGAVVVDVVQDNVHLHDGRKNIFFH